MMTLSIQRFAHGDITSQELAQPSFNCIWAGGSMSDHHGEGSHHHDEPEEIAVRVKGLEELLVSKGYVDSAALDALVNTYEHRIGPHIGARLVARAWVDAGFRSRLLTNAGESLKELGIGKAGVEELIFLKNTPTVRNVVVCTLCSCYPWAILGLPPEWYRSTPYRSRVVREPRVVLREMGLDVPNSVEIRVWDTTADLRYAVLPERPANTEHLDEDQLAAFVTRDSMIGVGDPIPRSVI